MIHFKSLFLFLAIIVHADCSAQEWPSIPYASWVYSNDGYSFKSFKLDVVNNSPYVIKKIKYRFYIYDQVYESYDYDAVLTSKTNIGPYETGQISVNLPRKRYLHYYKDDYGFSWNNEILDVEFYKTPEQINEEREAAERTRLEEERIAREEAEKERLRLEKLERDKRRDSLYNKGLNLYSKNQLREANHHFEKALSIDPNHPQSLKLNNEINQFFILRSGEGFTYRKENENDFANLLFQIKNLINDEMKNAKSGDYSLSVLISFDTLGTNNSSVLIAKSNPLSEKLNNLIRSSELKPSMKHSYFINAKDKIDLNLSWTSSTEYVVSNGKGISGVGAFFKKNPNDYKDFIQNLNYKYGNFTFEVKNKKLITNGVEQNIQDISLVKYKLNAGPMYAFCSLILPGWGSTKVSSGQKGFANGLYFFISLATAGVFKYLENSNYSNYENSINQSDIDEFYESANTSRKSFLISLGLAGIIYVYDFSRALVVGFSNIKKSSMVKKKLKNQSIEVKTSKF